MAFGLNDNENEKCQKTVSITIYPRKYDLFLFLTLNGFLWILLSEMTTSSTNKVQSVVQIVFYVILYLDVLLFSLLK